MRVFVTGASGFIGSAIVHELIDAGHQVLGLARSDAAAASLAAAGAAVHRGALDDLDSLKRGAAQADGVIHTAFNHDFSRFKESCENERRVVEALGGAVAGTERLLIVTSGTGLLAPGRLATEDASVPSGSSIPRVASEEAAAAAAARGARVAVVRLPTTVHGEGDHGFVPLLIGIARQKAAAAYVDEGRNRWPAVHRLDAAHLYRLVLEKGAAGARYHAVAEEGVPMRTIAEVIGHRLKLPVVAKTTPAEAAEHFGWFAHFAALDNPSSSAQTQAALGWRPTRPALIADLDQSAYFAA
jgi:nucleoside-diphosphate-sugar epimerase